MKIDIVPHSLFPKALLSRATRHYILYQEDKSGFKFLRYAERFIEEKQDVKLNLVPRFIGCHDGINAQGIKVA